MLSTSHFDERGKIFRVDPRGEFKFLLSNLLQQKLSKDALDLHTDVTS